MLIRANYQNLSLDGLYEQAVKTAAGTVNVISIYPHPDDETMASGGLMMKLAMDKRFKVKSLTTTKGEKGTAYNHFSELELGGIRVNELKEALKILKVNDFEVWDYPDGGVRDSYEALKHDLETYLQENKPGLIITYEKNGMYGHPDHVMLAKIIFELEHEGGGFKTIRATLPHKIAEKMDLPIFMADDPENLMQTEPEYVLNVIDKMIAKYTAAAKHKSQALLRGKRKFFIPLFGGYEYYTFAYPL